MSRHGKFYSELARRGPNGDEYDDDYYDDEDYEDYEEEYIHPKAPASAKQQPQASKATGGAKPSSPAPKTAKAQTTPSAPRPLASSLDAMGISKSEADYDLLVGCVRSVADVVGSFVPIERIVAAVRDANYDANAAVNAIISSPVTPPNSGSPISSPSPTVAKQQPQAVVLKSANGGSKTLKIGGSVAAVVPQVAHKDPEEGAEASAKAALPMSPSFSKFPSSAYASTEALDEDGKQTCTVIIAGHVDSGKSTILGHLLLKLGKFSERDVEKNEKEGKQSGKQSFKYAWLLDQSEEERRRGVTIDAGSHSFETEHKRVNVLDAPGHQDFVMNMISSATQADIALLVVTAATGEFESGLHHGTKEHLTILRTLGVSKIVVAINKLDTVQYSEERFRFVVQELKVMLRFTKFKEADVLGYCPVSGITGVNLVGRCNTEVISWYSGPTLVDMIDQAPNEHRVVDAPLRLTLQDFTKTTLFCKVEAGKVQRGDTVLFVPCGVKTVVRSIDRLSTGTIQCARAGDTVELQTNSDLTGLYIGCVGCSPKAPVPASTDFEVHIQTFPNLEQSIMPGALLMLAVHALSVPVTVHTLVAKMDKQGNWGKGMVKCVPKETQAIVRLQAETPLALEPADACRALGRFVLRQRGETVAGGFINKVLPSAPPPQ